MKKKGKALVFFDVIGSFGGAQRSTSVLLNEVNKRDVDFEVRALLLEGSDKRFVDALDFDVDFVNSFWAEKLFVARDNHLKSLVSLVFLSLRIAVFFFLMRGRVEALCNSPKALHILSVSKVLLWWKIDINYYARGWGRKSEFSKISVFLLNNLCKKIFCVSGQTSKNMQEFVKIKDRVYVTYTSVDTDSLPKKVKQDQIINRKFVILCAGAIIPAKGIDKVLSAVGGLAQELKDKTVVKIAGENLKNPDYYRFCESIVEKYGIDVQWLGWRKDVPDLIKQADAVFLISDTEGMPRVLQEAMAIGTLVVATPVGGVPDLIVDGETGYIVHKDPVKEMSTIIEGVFRYGIDSRILDQAKQHVELNFSLKNQVDYFIEALVS